MTDRHGGWGIWDLNNCQYIIHLGCIVNFLSSASLVSFDNNKKGWQWVWSNFSSNHWIRDSAEVWCVSRSLPFDGIANHYRWRYDFLA
jgi:hypothetical protein